MKKYLIIVTSILVFSIITSARSLSNQNPDNKSIIIVTSNLDSGNGSLREALAAAEAETVIRFLEDVFLRNAPAVIEILSGLPALDDGFVTIDASNSGVVLDGDKLNLDSHICGLLITSNGNIIQGLQIINFPGSGIYISDGSQNNIIGGAGKGEWRNSTSTGNIISGNYDGINIVGTNTAYNQIIGNFIGTDISGTIAFGNIVDGIWIGENAHDNIIGGRFGKEGNVISGNGANGIILQHTSGNLIIGNMIGLDISGKQALGNSGMGIGINFEAENNTVGGYDSANRNVISGNGVGGIILTGKGVVGNKIAGNYIGTGISGQFPVGNTGNGVLVTEGANTNEIGPGNIIAHNRLNGILISGLSTYNNILTRNSIFSNGEAAIRNQVGGNIELSTPSINQVDSRSVKGRVSPN